MSFKELEEDVYMWTKETNHTKEKMVAAFVRAQGKGTRKTTLLQWFRSNEAVAESDKGMAALMKHLKAKEPDAMFHQYESFLKWSEMRKISSETATQFIERLGSAKDEYEKDGGKVDGQMSALMMINRCGVDMHGKRMLMSAGRKEANGVVSMDPELVAQEIRRLAHMASVQGTKSGLLACDTQQEERRVTEASLEQKFEAFLTKKGLKLSPKKKEVSGKPKAAAVETDSSERKIRCYWCQQEGHIKPNCPAKKAGKPKTKEAGVATGMMEYEILSNSGACFGYMAEGPDRDQSESLFDQFCTYSCSSDFH
jgi:hypothetical protein